MATMKNTILSIALFASVMMVTACVPLEEATTAADSSFPANLVGTWNEDNGTDTYVFTGSQVTVGPSGTTWAGTYVPINDPNFQPTDSNVYTVKKSTAGNAYQVLYLYARVNTEGKAILGISQDETTAKSLATVFSKSTDTSETADTNTDTNTDTDTGSETSFKTDLVGSWSEVSGTDTFDFTTTEVTVGPTTNFWAGTYVRITDSSFTTTDPDVYLVKDSTAGTSYQILYLYAKVNTDGTATMNISSGEATAISLASSFSKSTGTTTDTSTTTGEAWEGTWKYSTVDFGSSSLSVTTPSDTNQFIITANEVQFVNALDLVGYESFGPCTCAIALTATATAGTYTGLVTSNNCGPVAYQYFMEWPVNTALDITFAATATTLTMTATDGTDTETYTAIK